MLSRTTILLYLLLGVVVCVSQADARPAEPGKEWVRSNPFTTSALIYSDIPWSPSTYKACNFNSSHPWAIPRYPHGNPILVQSSQANGLMWHCNINALTLTSTIINQVNNLSIPTQNNGWYVRDEPQASEFPGIAEVVNWLKTNRPNSLIYLSTADSTDEYVGPLLSHIQPDALSYCLYVFLQGSTRLDWWWSSTSRARNQTLAHGIPFFRWIQAFGGYAPDRHYRIPTEAEVRFQVYTSLAAGAKGVFFFIYDRDELSDFYYALTELGGAPTAIYYQVQGINTEVNNIGKALRYLTSTDIRYVRGGSSTVPSGLSNWSYGAGGNNLITNVQVSPNQSGTDKDGFIGFFNDDTGKQYFMLTNVFRGDSLNFTVTFSSSVNQITRLNRSTGTQQVLNLSNNTLNLSLPAGTGDLFCMTPNGFDLSAPSGSILINGGAASTGSRSVTLTLSATDDRGVTQMRFSNNLWNWTSWESYATSKQWTLTAGNGMKTVYAQFKDAVGTISPTCSATILLDIVDPYPRVQWLWQAANRSGAPGSRVSPFEDGVNTMTENNMSGAWAWYWDTPSMGRVSLRNTTSSLGRGFMDSNDFGEAFNVDTGITVAARIRPTVVSGFGSLCLSVNNSSTQDLSSPDEPSAKSTHMWLGWEDSGGKDRVIFASRAGTELKSFLYDNGNSLYRDTWCTWTLGAKQIGNTMAWDLWINGVHQSPTQQAPDGTYHTLVWSKSTDMGTSIRIGQRRPQSNNHDTAWHYVGITATGVVPGWDGLSDVSPPSVPMDLQATALSETSVQLTWTASIDNVGVTGYKIFRNEVQVGTSGTTSFTNTGLSAGTTYSYRFSAYDAAGNESGRSDQAVVTTLDTTPPSVPTNVQATAQSETSVQVTWTASTDNVGVTGYRIFRNGVLEGTSGTTSFLNTGLSPATTYSYRVSAYDAAGNHSAQSSQAVVTTPDNTPPSVPTNVQAAAKTPRMIELIWSASTDNVGVSGYRIFRNGVEIETSTTTSYTDTGLTPATSYSYTVSAYDAAGNNSGQSSPAAVASTMPAVDVASAKQLANGANVGMVSQIVTAVFDDFIYIEAADRYAGIRVTPATMPIGLTVGAKVDVGGTLQTVDAERQIGNAVVVITNGK